MHDSLITGGHLLTMQGDGVGFIEDGAIAIQDGKIVAAGPRAEVEAGGVEARATIDATNRLVMPGLVDAHMHSAAVLGRGWAQEVQTWMASAYGPMMRHVQDADAPLGTLLALIEGVMNGTTTFGDYEFPMGEVVKSHIQMGSRAVVCEGVTELNWSKREEWIAAGWKPGEPTPLDRETGEKTLASELRLYDEWNGFDDGRIKVIFGPHAADFLNRRSSPTRSRPICRLLG